MGAAEAAKEFMQREGLLSRFEPEPFQTVGTHRDVEFGFRPLSGSEIAVVKVTLPTYDCSVSVLSPSGEASCQVAPGGWKQSTAERMSRKSRHGCLTAYLIWLIVLSSASALAYLLGSDALRQAMPGVPGWAYPVLTVLAPLHLVCVLALFRWREWGFWGFCVSSVIAMGVNLSAGLGIGFSVGGLIGIALLYGVLHIGKENKGWPQLD